MTADPISTLAYAQHHACNVALPEFEYAQRKFGIFDPKTKKTPFEDVKAMRRPEFWEVNVYTFPQTWSNTACGHGGVAGQAFTTAYTVVVECQHSQACAVYFGPRLAYVVNTPNPSFWDDMGHYRLRGKGEGFSSYSSADLPPPSAELANSHGPATVPKPKRRKQ